MKPTRLPVLLAIGVLAGSVGWSVGLLIDGAGNTLPKVPPAAAGVLGLLAAILVGLALSTRSRLRAQRERRPDARPLNPLAAARYVVLARASSPVGAALFLEHVCRIPGDGPPETHGLPGPRADQAG